MHKKLCLDDANMVSLNYYDYKWVAGSVMNLVTNGDSPERDAGTLYNKEQKIQICCFYTKNRNKHFLLFPVGRATSKKTQVLYCFWLHIILLSLFPCQTESLQQPETHLETLTQ